MKQSLSRSELGNLQSAVQALLGYTEGIQSGLPAQMREELVLRVNRIAKILELNPVSKSLE